MALPKRRRFLSGDLESKRAEEEYGQQLLDDNPGTAPATEQVSRQADGGLERVSGGYEFPLIQCHCLLFLRVSPQCEHTTDC